MPNNNIGAINYQVPHFNSGTLPLDSEVQETTASHDLDDAQKGESFGFCADVNDCQRVFNEDGTFHCGRCNITG